MKRKSILFSTALIATSIIGFQGTAKADYINDVINDTNALTSDVNSYYTNVLTPAVEQRYYYLQALANLCYQGNASACYEYDSATASEHRRLSNAVEQMRNRANPYYQ